MLYFAYGSNLSEQNRIKNNINITKVKNYKLKGYKYALEIHMVTLI